MTQPPRLCLERHENLAALERLREEWDDLVERSPWATPFHSPAWLIPWWRHLGAGELSVLTLRRDGRLVALGAFFVETAADGARALAMLGTGISDYEGLLLDAHGAGNSARCLMAHLARACPAWERAEVRELRPDAPLLRAPVPPSMRVRAAPSSVCPVIALPPSMDALLARLPGRARRHLRNSESRLARAGGGRIIHADAESLPRLLDVLFTLHRRRWEARGEPGVLAHPPLRAFHGEAAAGLLARGMLRLYGLELAGALAGVLYGFALARRTYLYLQAMDPAASAAAPGAALVRHAIAQAIREGHREVDLLRGREPYKYTWGARDRQNVRLEITPQPAPRRPAARAS